MSRSTFTKVGVVLVSIIGALAVTACSCMSNPPARVYYLDNSCSYYYVDGAGNNVYSGRYSDAEFIGVTLKQDCDGRWFYSDNVGNKVYVSKRCSMHFHHKVFKDSSCMMK